VVDRVTLSTRTIFRSDDADDLRDIQRFNSGFQGSSVVVQGGGSRQPVGSSLNAVESFRFPDVEFVNEAKVEVAGLPYRAYSSGALDNADYTQVADSGAIGGNDTVTVGPGVTLVDSYTPPSSVSISWVIAYVKVSVNDDNGDPDIEPSARLVVNKNDTFRGDLPQNIEGDFGDYDSASGRTEAEFRIIVPFDASGDTIELGLNNNNQSGNKLDVAYSVRFVSIGKHTHDPDPGIIEDFTGQPEANASGTVLPSNVDLLINGNTVATDIGSGEFETVVDVAGEFNVDAFNTIEAASDSLGHIRLTPFVEAYKQIGKQ